MLAVSIVLHSRRHWGRDRLNICQDVNGAGSFCDQNTSKLFVLCGRIYGRTHECTGGLLKVRERKYKGDHGGAQVEFGGRESMLFFLILLKLILIYGKGGTR
jgi:hypothetical protein